MTRHVRNVFMLNEVFICIFTFAKIGQKKVVKSRFMPTIVPRNMIYNSNKCHKTHIYIIEIYRRVPVSFSFLAFDICAQKFIWLLSP